MGFYTIFKRDLKNLIYNPIMIIYTIIYPFLSILILGYLTNGNYEGGAVSSYDYYTISIMTFFALFTATISANSFMEKRVKSSNLRIMYSPISMDYIYLSKMAATFIFSSVLYLIVMCILKVMFNINYGGRNVIYVILLLELFNLFTSSLGVLFCCIFKSEDIANKILSPFLNIFGIFGGCFFPIFSLGKTIEKLSCLSPAKWAIEAIFKIIYDNDFSSFAPAVIIFIVLTILAVLGCKLTFKEEDYV